MSGCEMPFGLSGVRVTGNYTPYDVQYVYFWYCTVQHHAGNHYFFSNTCSTRPCTAISNYQLNSHGAVSSVPLHKTTACRYIYTVVDYIATVHVHSRVYTYPLVGVFLGPHSALKAQYL
jgi:hypothetical protein